MKKGKLPFSGTIATFAFMLFLCGFAPAYAYADAGDISRWPGFTWRKSAGTGYAGLDKFVGCIIANRMNEIRTVLAIDEASDQFSAAVSSLATSSEGCMGQLALKFSTGLFRKSLINGVYRQEVLEGGIAAPTVQLGKRLHPNQPADCIARQNLAETDALLRSIPGSPAEKAAWSRLAATLTQCGVSTKRPGNFQGIRYEIAESAYNWRVANKRSSQ